MTASEKAQFLYCSPSAAGGCGCKGATAPSTPAFFRHFFILPLHITLFSLHPQHGDRPLLISEGRTNRVWSIFSADSFPVKTEQAGLLLF